jgi:hypothetical protein
LFAWQLLVWRRRDKFHWNVSSSKWRYRLKAGVYRWFLSLAEFYNLFWRLELDSGRSVDQLLGSVDQLLGSVDQLLGSVDQLLGSVDQLLASWPPSIQKVKVDWVLHAGNAHPVRRAVL